MMETTKNAYTKMNYDFAVDAIPVYESYSISGSFIKLYGSMMLELHGAYHNMMFTDMMTMYDRFLKIMFVCKDSNNLNVTIGELYEMYLDRFSDNKFISICDSLDNIDKTQEDFKKFISFVLSMFKKFTRETINSLIAYVKTLPVNINVNYMNYPNKPRYEYYIFFCEDKNGNCIKLKVDSAKYIVTIISNFSSKVSGNECVLYDTFSPAQSTIIKSNINIGINNNNKSGTPVPPKVMDTFRKFTQVDIGTDLKLND